MSLHIHRFVDLIKATEARGQRDLFMSIKDAKDLHADITKLLVTLEQIRQQLDQQTAAVTVELDGGGFRDNSSHK